MKVFINPGHAPNGVPDPGAVNPVTGDRECDYALTCGEQLRDYLIAAGCKAAMLQSDSLSEICETSNAWEADVFVSIHCNAFNTMARGTETLYKSEAGKALAECIQSQIINSIDTLDRGIKQRDRLWVLNSTNAPAVLVELAFIDNANDLELMKTQLNAFSAAIARGVTDYARL